MPKRFTATEKWDDAWYCALAPLDKLFWSYLTDKCDAAGLWDVNEPLVKFHIGQEYMMDPEKFAGRVVVVATGKWFIPGFISFQYGELHPGCKHHAHILQILQKHQIKGYLKGIQTLKDNIGQGQDKDKDTTQARFTAPNVDEVRSYCQERKNAVDPEAFVAYYEARGWKIKGNSIKSWKACVITWEKTGFCDPTQAAKNSPKKSEIKVWACRECKRGKPEVQPDPDAWDGGLCKECAKEFA